MAEVSKPSEIYLNGIRYPTIGRIRQSLISQFPGKIVVGDYTKESEHLASSWVISDQRGGILVEEMEEKIHLDRCFFSTCELGFKGHLFLPSLATAVTAPAVGGESTETLRPNGAGSLTQLTPNTGANWQCVDEATADDDTTYVQNATLVTSKQDLYALPAHSGSGTISKVRVYVRCRSDSYTGFISKPWCKPYMRTHETNYQGSTTYLTSSWATLSHDWTTNPYTSEAWTWDEIDALETGVNLFCGKDDASDTIPARCTQAYVVVYYAADSIERSIFADFNNKRYVARGTKLCSLNAAGDTFTAIKSDFATPITALIPFGSNLIIFCGNATNYWYMNTSETFAQTNVATAVLGLEWQGKVFKIAADGQLSYCATPATATPSWTNNGKLDIGTGMVNSLFLYRDATGEEIIYAGTKKGLYAHDYTNAKWLETELSLPEHPYCAKGAARWRDAAFVAAGLDVLKYIAAETATISSVGLGRDDGLPEEYTGEIVKLVKGYNDLFALIDASLVSDVESYSFVGAYNGGGWQVKWADGTLNQSVYGMSISSIPNYRLWFDVGDTIYWIPLQRNVRNPRKISTFPYGSSSIHITPWFDADWLVGNKLALEFVLECDGMSANETVQVSYRINHSSTNIGSVGTEWTSLGTITSDGETTYSFGSDAGITFRSIQFRFDLSRGGTNTLSPDILWARLKYKKVLPAAWGWSGTLDCTKDYDGRSLSQMVTALITAAETETLMDFAFLSGGASETHKVAVKTVSGENLGGEDKRGRYFLQVVEP